jgi:hypothetical protein
MSEGGPARGSPVRGPCPGDLDSDGVVGIIDFPTALGTRGLCPVVEPSRGGGAQHSHPIGAAPRPDHTTMGTQPPRADSAVRRRRRWTR